MLVLILVMISISMLIFVFKLVLVRRQMIQNIMHMMDWFILIIYCRKTINMTNKMNELSLKEKACKSLLANVLDMDDDLRSDFDKLSWSMFLIGLILMNYHGRCF